MTPAASPTASTRLLAVLGWPVGHSRSPEIHNAALRHLDLDLVYVALPVHPDDLATAVAGLGAVGCVGASVTIPHKQAVVDLCDRLSDEARLIGAVNTLSWREDGLHGENTDAPGLVRALDEAGAGPGPVLVFGTGGAARAAVVGIARSGREVVVAGRRVAAAAELAGLAARAGGVGRAVDAADVGALSDAVAGCDTVVNATPLGMSDERLPDPLMALRADQLAHDMVYAPPVTPFLAAAADRGARAVNGLPMLVHQAAVAFEDWTGRPAPVTVMMGVVT